MYGLGESVLELLRNYLTDRTQKCHLHSMLSKQRKITFGFSQGSILSPLLFLLYVGPRLAIREMLSTKLQKLQNRAIRVMRTSYDTNAGMLLDTLHLNNLSLRRKKLPWCLKV